MAQPRLVILGIIMTGVLLVIFPVGLATFYRYRNRKVITCPGTHGPADVQLNARQHCFRQTTSGGSKLLAGAKKKGLRRSLRQTELARAVIRGAPKSPVTKIQLMEFNSILRCKAISRLIALFTLATLSGIVSLNKRTSV